MKAARIIVAGLLAGGVALAGSTIGLHPPRSRVGRDVLVFWFGSGQRERLVRPGTCELEFRCTHRKDKVARVLVEVIREKTTEAEDDGGYRECTAEQVRQLAKEGRAAQVRFADAFREKQFAAEGEPLPMRLPDGQNLPVCYTFLTEAPILCVVPDQGPDLELLRSAMAGDRLYIRGQVFGVRGLGPCVVVDRVRFDEPEQAKDEPSWTARLRWAGRDVITATESGDYSAQIPCAHVQGATELLGVRLREFKVVELDIKGNQVTAELADTPELRSYGLQGRQGLEPGQGMLFFFPRPLRPRFVMKGVSFPLSVAFIRSDGLITNVARISPGDQRGVTSPVPVNYVLEMERGWFEEQKVAPGDRVVIP